MGAGLTIPACIFVGVVKAVGSASQWRSSDARIG